ncbi:exopolysaccharide biosynthesis protein [Salinicola acroporae]|uniref:Exopolysaccharide biosynthesis protein exod n=1 Tax=Salinicola acroporae TaxID=1541440 RepID=A0ABT6I5D9_9GAMM|nr:exopolysaccharide biosynthesis protein [Salinicola acroporae]MDH4572751.1 exopolysaccharide biosynthesis protein exod [Salinicola acroporae]
MSERMKLTDILETLDDQVEDETITLQDIVDTFNARGFGPVVLLPALIALLPTGGVPGVPSLCGIFIALMAIQLVFGRRSPWLPGTLAERGISHERWHRVTQRVRPWTRRIDRFLAPRLSWLMGDVTQRLLALLMVVLGLGMMPLELLPFAAAIPALAIVIMALGLTAGDGLMMLIGLAITVAGGIGIGLWLI